MQGQGARPQPRFGNGSAPGQRLQPGLPATGWIQSRIAARTKMTACSPRPPPSAPPSPPEGSVGGGEDTERGELISKAKVAISVRRCEATSPPPASPSPHRRLIARYLLMFFFHPSKRWSSACSGAAPALLCLQATLRRRSTGGEGGSPRDAGSAAPTAAWGGFPRPPLRRPSRRGATRAPLYPPAPGAVPPPPKKTLRFPLQAAGMNPPRARAALAAALFN